MIKEENMGGIYQLQNLVNGSVYIGSAKEFCWRWGQHLDNLRRGTHTNPHLQRAFAKYGESNFEFGIVEVMGTPAEYDKPRYFARENIFIDQARSSGKCYNIAKAEGGWTHHTYERKAEISAKISLKLKALNSTRTYEERSAIYGGGNRSRKKTPEEILKISLKMKGVPKSIETRLKMSESHLTPERRAVDQENGRAVGLSNTGKPANNRKAVIVGDQEFPCLKDAAAFMKTCSSTLCTALKYSRKLKGHDVRYK